MNNTFYLVRHGESRFNVENRHQGWKVGVPLTPLGHTQANIVADYLANHTIDVIFSSPLLRAKQTASATAKRKKTKIQYSRKLLDFRRSASQEGLKATEYLNLPEYQMWKNKIADDLTFSLPDGESKHDFYKRVAGFGDDCNKNFDSKNILIVTHLDTISHLIFHWTGVEINRNEIDNCSIFQVNPETKRLEILTPSS